MRISISISVPQGSCNEMELLNDSMSLVDKARNLHEGQLKSVTVKASEKKVSGWAVFEKYVSL